MGELAEDEMADKFPDENLMILKVKLNDEEPWYVDYVNYIVKKVIPPKWTPERRKRFFSQVRNYFWDEPYAFRLCLDNVMRRCVAETKYLKSWHTAILVPPGDIIVPRLQEERFTKQDSIGLVSLKMLKIIHSIRRIEPLWIRRSNLPGRYQSLISAFNFYKTLKHLFLQDAIQHIRGFGIRCIDLLYRTCYKEIDDTGSRSHSIGMEVIALVVLLVIDVNKQWLWLAIKRWWMCKLRIGPTFVGEGDKVGDVFLIEVDFDGSCRGDGDFSLGRGDGVLILLSHT
nr:hypothetical protein [Tanacetum cinerariifolium]